MRQGRSEARHIFAFPRGCNTRAPSDCNTSSHSVVYYAQWNGLTRVCVWEIPKNNMYRTMVWLYFSLNLQTLDLEVGILKAELPHSQKQGCDGLAFSDIRDFISLRDSSHLCKGVGVRARPRGQCIITTCLFETLVVRKLGTIAFFIPSVQLIFFLDLIGQHVVLTI